MGVGADGADLLRRAGVEKQVGQHIAEEPQKGACQHRIDGAQQHTVAHALVDTVDFTRAGILAGIGGHGGAHGIEGTAEKQADLTASGHRGHIDGAQRVDCRLQHDAADGRDGVLQPHGQAHEQQAADAATNGNGRMARNVLEKAILNQAKRLIADADADLALLLPFFKNMMHMNYHRGSAGTGDAHLQHGHGENIENDVETGGEQQKQQRRLGVAQRADQARQCVI